MIDYLLLFAGICFMTFTDILELVRQSATEKEKGNKFEKLMKRFFQNDNRYKGLLSDVWLWDEFPYKEDLGGRDLGIDLVAKTNEDTYWAIQCKCYAKETVIDKKAADSFIATSSRGFGEKGKLKFALRVWVSTSNKWGANAEETLNNQNPPVTRLTTADLDESSLDWNALWQGKTEIKHKTKKPMDHQKEAVQKANDYFKDHDRGKLIMACGTGKTYTSLLITESMVKKDGFVLFMVPSIALLGQALNAWMADTSKDIYPIGVCSDATASEIKKNAKEDFDEIEDNLSELSIPASTNVKTIIKHIELARAQKKLPVIFSTYQSIDVVSQAQKAILKETKNSFGAFDLIVCDESHRTTGVKYGSVDESHFVKIHSNQFIQGHKRLYMTATPRVYGESAKSKAKEQDDCILFSMDDTQVFGEEFYRVGFGYAVDKGLLTDYKVLVLSVNEYDLPPSLLTTLKNNESKEFDFDDSSKMIGVISALSKLIQGDDGVTWNADPGVMKRAVAFCQKIGKPNMPSSSKNFEKVMPYISEQYEKDLKNNSKNHLVNIEARHVDGSMSASARTSTLDWLKEETESNTCRIVSNVRCLSEGVDVPALDAVIFMSPRNSQVDVVQSVGRVMRTFKKGSPNEKKYGYIIIPVVVPLDQTADEALNDNKRFKVVWDILNALRSHDDRFNAEVNSVLLNKKTPPRIVAVKPAAQHKRQPFGARNNDEPIPFDPSQIEIRFHEFEAAFKARLVEKVGEKYYWENWAKSIGVIAKKFIARIDYLRDLKNSKISALFEKYLAALHKNINNSVTEEDAVQMLAQHMITQPVFDALFGDYKFIENNSISRTMTRVIKELRKEGVDQEVDELEKFYTSVRTNVGQLDNLEGKQKVIKELYEKFFKSAFPTTVEKLGIVYTPIECVDFIVHSVNILLHEEFHTDLTNRDVHILDPFTGTGTFITRLLQSGLIKKEDLERKYKKELHANEIVLLAYYIADVNIESVYHYLNKSKEYLPFNGICLTDTFQTAEHKGSSQESVKLDDYFSDNYKEVEKQRKTPVRVIIGNPPYSVGQKSANDNAQNLSYPILDARIEDTYAAKSSANLKKSLYDSYIKAFRLASDRIQKNKEGGIVAFITNGGWLDSNATDGMRKSLVEEFTSIWVLNLRGNQRTSGELSKKEGGKIFGSGSRTPVTITFLVYNPNKKEKPCEIHYHDIGDYLTRERKLEILKEASSIQQIKWESITPNEKADWINQRGDVFDTLTPLIPEQKFDHGSKSFFVAYSAGLKTNRDAWCYNNSSEKLEINIKASIDFYNNEVQRYQLVKNKGIKPESFINFDPTKFSWDAVQKESHLSNGKLYSFEIGSVRESIYRPFFKRYVYFNHNLNNRVYQIPKLFPTPDTQNLVICVKGIGDKDFSCIITDSIPDLQVIFNGQCFPLYYYAEQSKSDLFSQELEKRDGISNWALAEAKRLYGSSKKITKENIFYYVYGFLHSKDYRETFKDDLKKSLPKIIFVSKYEDFCAFERAGRALANLHLNYEKSSDEAEKIAKTLGINITGNKLTKTTGQTYTPEDYKYFRIPDKMRFASKADKTKIFYNNSITIENIPERAYEYIVNGKSAIDWILERYAVTQDKDSLITNDCNDWALEHQNPRYILDTLVSVIDLSLKTMDIVNGLPKLEFGE